MLIIVSSLLLLVGPSDVPIGIYPFSFGEMKRRNGVEILSFLSTTGSTSTGSRRARRDTLLIDPRALCLRYRQRLSCDILFLFTKCHHNDDLRNFPAISVIPLRTQRRNRITKIAGVASTSGDISSMPRNPATSPDSAVSLLRVEWGRAVPNMSGKYKYYSVCYMFETSISDACHHLPR